MGCLKLYDQEAREAKEKSAFFSGGNLEEKESALKNCYNYYPFGLTFNSYQRSYSKANNFLYNGKELQEETGWLDYGARMYNPSIGRWHNLDPLADLYFGTSPYTYALNNVINAIDPDGQIVIFINGNHFGDGGSSKYWRSGGNQFDTQVMNRLNDHNAIYRDGSVGGWAPINPLLLNNDNSYRTSRGQMQGGMDAEQIIANLKRDKSGNIVESIKIISHSMGGSYAKGYAKALLEYAKKHEIDGVVIDFEADFAPYQSANQNAVKDENMGPTLQFSHSNDMVAGNDPIDGAEQKDTNDDENQGHSIFSFMKQVSKLPAGNYKVKNGEIVPDKEKKDN